MQLPISKASETHEIQRLKQLLDPALRSQITIIPLESKNNLLITTQARNQAEFEVQIDFRQWNDFTDSQRDLLFWHEVARIQNRAIAHSSWEPMAIGIGLSAALMELLSHSLLSFVVALAVTGLASYKLYQRKLGEQSLRAATAADQTAIELALQAGYSFTEAHQSLYEAIRILTKRSAQTVRRNQYEVRLRVLEMLATQRNTSNQISPLLNLDFNARKVQNSVF